jgi:hypothetical protein
MGRPAQQAPKRHKVGQSGDQCRGGADMLISGTEPLLTDLAGLDNQAQSLQNDKILFTQKGKPFHLAKT